MRLAGAARLTVTLAELDGELRRALGISGAHAETSTDDVVSDAEESVRIALERGAAGNALSAEDVALVSRSLHIQLSLRQFIADRGRQRIDSLAASIRRLTTHPHRHSLPAQLCSELVDAAGFAAVAHSVVDGTQWIVTACAGSAGPLPAASTAPVTYPPGDVEKCCTGSDPDVRLVDGTSATPMIGRLLGTTAYVAAPVRTDRRIAGMIYAAPAPQLPVTADDAELLALYASAVAAVAERGSSADRIHRHHEILADRVAALVADAGRIATAELTIDAVPDADDRPTPANQAIERLLTGREIDVMRLIALGASNAEIADRLAISVETVKSHVKKILRKVGAVNRSEAISLFLDS
ncbi:helix-turn-helix transcriptional regulator [Gordonia sp. TBRC 11910]|uniref:Helix-turn-helix transcriptional regulator n=1 Tax=Gordonia asplenii TaxID=2725283 RepID=A0A848KUB8_9ACTN|nr:helix-turn-helix transcriptional regulator [Gordonia asplenii]NMO02286.1 helix-turn-helix transcriptional regulator [Gordonia asplenii]